MDYCRCVPVKFVLEFFRYFFCASRKGAKCIKSGGMSRIFLSVSFLFFGVLWASGQAVDSSRVYELQEAVVVGRGGIAKEVIPVQVLAGEELERLSVHSVADAMRYFSGVQVKDYGGIGGLKTVNIRSMGSQHVGVFYDGIELGNAQNGVIDLGRFSLDNMEAISMYNGQRSAVLQPAKDFASAGSVYLRARVPRFDSLERFHVKGVFKTGSFGLANPSLLWEQRLGKRVSSSLSAEYMYTTGRYRFSYSKKGPDGVGYDTTEIRRNGDVRSVRGEYGLFGDVEDGEWKAKVYFYRSERGYPGASVRENPGEFKHQDRQWDTDFFMQGSLRKRVSERYSFLLNGKYGYNYLHYRSDPRLDVTTMYVDNRFRQQEGYVSAGNEFTIFPFWSAGVSADFLWNRLRADLVDFVYPRRYTTLVAVATGLDFERFKLQASLLGTFVQERTRLPYAAAGNKQRFTPTVIVSGRPFRCPDFHLRAFYKRIFRMPTLNDLYYTFIGNKDLKPEYTVQYNVGATYGRSFGRGVLRRLEVQGDVYYNEVTDKIVAMPTSNQFRWTMVNLGVVEVRGADVAVQADWRWRGGWQLGTRLTYTWQRAEDYTNPEGNYYGDQIPYIPWHSASVVLNGTWRQWDLNYSFIYTGERYESSANIPENYAQPWYTSDVSLSRQLRLRDVGVRLTVEVNNLFNQQYEVVQCYPMPGTNCKVIIHINL